MRRVVGLDVPACLDCSVEGKLRARGLCKNCYQRRWRSGQDMPPRRGLSPGTYQQVCQRSGCGRLFKVRPSEVEKAAQRNCSPPIYCSMVCRSGAYVGAGNPKWRGGVVRQPSGYLYEYAPDHPHATRSGYVMQHRLVVEREIGRILDPVEEVHHRNHIRDDNRYENLEVQADKRAHRVLHAYYQESTCPTCSAPVTTSAAHRRRFTRKFCSRRCSALAGSAANVESARRRRSNA